MQVVNLRDSDKTLLRKNLYPTTGKVAAGAYGLIVRRFASLTALKICFRALWNCDPLTDSAGSNVTGQKCYLSSEGVLDSSFYPPRCVHIHVKQNPQVFSVLPAEVAQINKSYTFRESSIVPPWRKSITNATVLMNVGERLSLNVDAYDPNEGDDIDVGVTMNSILPNTASLGPRLCCSDDFAFCEERPLNFRKLVYEESTQCETDINSDPPESRVTSVCNTACIQRAEPMPCRNGKFHVEDALSCSDAWCA